MAEVRTRIAAYLEAVSGWREAVHDPERMVERETAAEVTFGLEVVRSEPHDGPYSAVAGGLWQTQILVHWQRWCAEPTHAAKMTAALAQEEAARLVLLSSSADLHIRIEGLERETTDEWVRGRIELVCTHALAVA